MTEHHVLGPAAALPPGERAVFDLGRRQIGVFNIEGEFYALPNTCFHQNGPVCRGIVRGTVMADAASDYRPEWRLDGEILVCPWHSLEFHVKTGRSIAYPGRSLPTYRVTVRDGMLMVEL